MNNYSAISMIMLTALAAGCAAGPSSAARQAQLAEIQRTTPTCSSPTECDAKWEMAQLWVVKNAGFKMQTVTSVLIETYNPTDYSPSLAVQVTKEPVGDGVYKIIASPWCANPFGCSRDKLDARLDFNRTVNAAHGSAPVSGLTYETTAP